MEIQVFGAGSLGTLVGALLADAGHDVHLVGRPRHVEAIQRDGVHVSGSRGFTAYPTAATGATDVDLTLVTVKSYDTREAAEQIRGRQDAVVSLQNGMGNEDVLREAVDSTVLAGVATYGARKTGEGEVEYTGEGVIRLGSPEGGGSSVAEETANALSSGVEAEARDDMPGVLWRKLAVNAGVNPVTALTGLSNGEAVERAGDLVREAAEETGRVAVAADVDVEPERCGETAIEVAEQTSDNLSSMLRDVERGRRTEVDAINGYVADTARQMDVEASVNRTLHSLVSAAEPRSR